MSHPRLQRAAAYTVLALASVLVAAIDDAHAGTVTRSGATIVFTATAKWCAPIAATRSAAARGADGSTSPDLRRAVGYGRRVR